jgi:hypothetical protein
MNEAIAEKFETAEEGSTISDVAALKELCDQTVAKIPDPVVNYDWLSKQATIDAAQRDYVFYNNLYEDVAKLILEGRREALKKLAEVAPVGHHFQDRDGVVYQLCDKKGTFVEFTPFEMKRTQRVYAEGGSHVLARKTAEECGYQNIFKPAKPEAAKE